MNGAVRMRVKTTDKNKTIIHKFTSLQSIDILWSKSWVFVRNKYLSRHFKFKLTLSGPKIWVHNNSSSSENSSRIKIHQHNCSELFWVCLVCVCFSPDSDETTFALGKAILWIEDSYFSEQLIVKHFDLFLFSQTCSFSLYKMLTMDRKSCGLLVDYCDVFIRYFGLSSWWPIHCRRSISEQVM